MRSIEDIILEKKYDELSTEELLLVNELAENEEEFNQMKQLFDNMSIEFDSVGTVEASIETKSSLDSIFAAKHPVIANDWKKEEVVEEVKVIAFYNRSWVRVAAILLLFLGVSIPFLKNSDEIISDSAIQQAKLETPAETTHAKAKNTVATTEDLASAKTDEKKYASAETLSGDKDQSEPSIPGKVVQINDVSLYDKRMNVSKTALTYQFSAPITTFGSSTATAAGLASDLYPNGKPLEAENKSSITSEVSAADMLDWIQAAY